MIVVVVIVVESLSHVRLFVTPWSVTWQASLHHLLEFAQTHINWLDGVIKPSYSLSPPSPPAFNLSQHQGLSQWVSSYIRWPKYWSFSFSISPSNEHSGLISFRMDSFDLLAVQGTQESSPTPQFKGINSLVLSLLEGLILTVHTWLLAKP